MPSTYLSLHYHIVFGTKNRIPSINEPWGSRLHEYLGGTIRGLGGFLEGVGCTADHVHFPVGLKATHCLAEVMRELKKASWAWMHQEVGDRAFAWQEGYAAFTASATIREAVQKYIAHLGDYEVLGSRLEGIVHNKLRESGTGRDFGDTLHGG